MKKNKSRLLEALIKQSGCKKIPTIELPIAWIPYVENNKNYYKNAWPNPVNSQIINSHLLIPDPNREEIRVAISASLKSYGLTHEFMKADELESLYGGIHCASKALHVCR